MLFKKKNANRKKVALALGSGNFKGLSHIGVIKALEKANIPIDMIAGTSIGALVGAMYAASKNIKDIEEIALSVDEHLVSDLLYDFSIEGGFIKGDKIKEFIKNYFDDLQFSDLRIPFRAVASDLTTGKALVISEGDLTEALRASISIPIIFQPVQRSRHFLVDGSLTEPVPVLTAKTMGADVVIAVNLNTAHCFDPKDLNLKGVLECTMDIARKHLADECVRMADMVIEPKIDNTGLIKFDGYYKRNKEIIRAGEKAAEEIIPKLKMLYF